MLLRIIRSRLGWALGVAPALLALLALLVPASALAAPTVTINTPAANTPDYPDTAVPAADYSCTADPSSTLSSCTATVDGAPVASGAPLPDGVGSHSMVVTATDADGLSTPQTVTYTVSGPPAISIQAPAATAYGAAAVPAAAFACTADPHSPLSSCTATVDGSPVSTGGALPTAVGSHTLTVSAADQDGLTDSRSVAYTVNAAPTCAAVNVTADEGRPLRVSLSCRDAAGAALTYVAHAPARGSLSSLDTRAGTVVYTPAAGFVGIDTFGYHATSSNGTAADAVVTVTVVGPPSATIASPAGNQVYTIGQRAPTRFGCAEAANGPGISSCMDSNGAPSPSGSLNTSTEGTHSYTVTAISGDGLISVATLRYTVVGNHPQVSVVAPVNNASYLWNQVPQANFSCVAGKNGKLQSCKAAIDGQSVSTGQPLVASAGKHTMTITATDTDGLSTTATVTYTIIVSLVPPPPVSITSPVQGARYLLGQVVKASYTCLGSGSGPALEACTGSVAAGKPIDTRTVGPHSFSVSATDSGGESTTETVTYTVSRTGNHFTISQLRLAGGGVARLRLRLPGPGTVAVDAQAFTAAGGRAGRRRFAYGAARRRAHRGGALTIDVKPNARGRALLHRGGASTVITLAVTYTPTGGRPRRLRAGPLRVRRA
jgi:hypothetical protein